MSQNYNAIERIRYGLRISIYDGASAHIFGNLTGSIFLPAFALLLGATPLQIGILASIPFFAALAQLLGSFWVEKYQKRKTIAILFSSLARGSWLFIILLGLVFSEQQFPMYLKIVIVIVALYHLLGAVSGVAWLSWMSSLVPAEIRGRFFGLRNSILGIITIIITISGGYFLDWFSLRFPEISQVWSFKILFSIAILFGFLSIYFLRKQPEQAQTRQKQNSMLKIFRDPLQKVNYRKFLRFAILWSFGVNFTSPFFIVYMIRDLQLVYTLIGILTVTSAIADLTGMGIWGHFSDRYGNRPILIVTAIVATILPFFWIFTNTSVLSVYVIIPLLHIIGGFVWSGYNLCSVNMIFHMAPPERNSAYFAFWSIFNGLAAGLGAITGGIFSNYADQWVTFLPIISDSGFKLIFLTSAILRFISLFQLRKVREEGGLPVKRLVRILRSVRLWATMMGHHPLVQFFIPSDDKKATSPRSSNFWPIWDRNKK